MQLEKMFCQIDADSRSLHGGRLFSVSGNAHSPPWLSDVVLGRGAHPINAQQGQQAGHEDARSAYRLPQPPCHIEKMGGVIYTLDLLRAIPGSR